MNENEIFTRLAEVRASSQSAQEKCAQAFLLIASFLQNTGSSPVPPEFKKRLRALVDEFYLRANGPGRRRAKVKPQKT